MVSIALSKAPRFNKVREVNRIRQLIDKREWFLGVLLQSESVDVKEIFALGYFFGSLAWILNEFGVIFHYETHELEKTVSHFEVVDVEILVWIDKGHVES